jgi:hypothetical protein
LLLNNSSNPKMYWKIMKMIFFVQFWYWAIIVIQ